MAIREGVFEMTDDVCKNSEECDRRRFMAGAAVGFALMPLSSTQVGAEALATSSGSVKLTSYLDGEFSLPVAAIARGKSEAEIKAALAAAGHDATQARSILNVPVLRRGKEIILFDVGAGQNFMPGTGKLVEALAQSGIQPDQVTHVIFSHGHPDHLWGALDDFGTLQFANAKHFFPQADWNYWFSADIYKRLPEERHSFVAGAQRILKAIQADLTMFKAGDEVVSSIAAIGAPGHTPGHMAFEVKSDEGLLIIGADALTHPVLSFQHPDWHGPFDDDGALAVKSRHLLLERSVSEKARLTCYHLPAGGIGRVEKKDGAYRFIQF